jgi:hypothetical protein
MGIQDGEAGEFSNPASTGRPKEKAPVRAIEGVLRPVAPDALQDGGERHFQAAIIT